MFIDIASVAYNIKIINWLERIRLAQIKSASFQWSKRPFRRRLSSRVSWMHSMLENMVQNDYVNRKTSFICWTQKIHVICKCFIGPMVIWSSNRSWSQRRCTLHTNLWVKKNSNICCKLVNTCSVCVCGTRRIANASVSKTKHQNEFLKCQETLFGNWLCKNTKKQITMLFFAYHIFAFHPNSKYVIKLSVREWIRRE